MSETLRQRVETLGHLWSLHRRREYRRVHEALARLPWQRLLEVPELGYMLAVARDRLGEHEEALSLLLRLTPALEREGNGDLYRRCLNRLAAVWIERGVLGEADNLLLTLLGAAEEGGDHYHVGMSCHNLGVVAQIRCAWTQALMYYHRSSAAMHRLGLRRQIGGVHHNLGMMYRELGQLEQSATHFEHALRLYRREASEDEVADVHLERAILLARLGDFRLAQSTAERARAVHATLGRTRDVADAHRVLGVIALARGDLSVARRHLDLALPVARATANPLLEAEVLEELAALERAGGNATAARATADAAAKVYVGMGAEARAERMRARLAAPEDGPARASGSTGATKREE